MLAGARPGRSSRDAAELAANAPAFGDFRAAKLRSHGFNIRTLHYFCLIWTPNIRIGDASVPPLGAEKDGANPRRLFVLHISC